MTHSSSSSDDDDDDDDEQERGAASTGVSVSTFVGADPTDDDDPLLERATIAPYLISKKDLDRISSIKKVGENVPAGIMAINQLRALGVLRFVPFKPKSHLAAMRAAKLAGDNAAAALAAATPTAPSETRADPGELLATLRAEIADDFAPIVPKAPNSSTASTTETKPKKKKAKKMKTKTKRTKKKSKTTKKSQSASASKPTIVCHATFGEGKNYWAGESEELEA